jgi:hypothetical protein
MYNKCITKGQTVFCFVIDFYQEIALFVYVFSILLINLLACTPVVKMDATGTGTNNVMKSSKTSVLFAQVNNIERFKGATKVDPCDFDKNELQAFEAFKRQKKAEYARNRRKANPENVRAIEARYRSKPGTKIVKQAYERRPYVKARHRKWKTNNPEKMRKYHKTYRERHYEQECERVKTFLRQYRGTDKYREYKKNYLKSPEYRWHCVQQSAKPRGLIVELNREDVAAMCIQPCFYCGQDPKELDCLFGIDRFDNSMGYTKANSVTCCTFCNYAKCDHHIEDFYRGMCNIAANVDDDIVWQFNYAFTDVRKCQFGGNYFDYSHSASVRKILFELSKEEFDQLTVQPCFYCQRPSGCGVDRVDNNVGYTMKNCVACCSLCNKFKKNWDIDFFIYKAKLIAVKYMNSGK